MAQERLGTGGNDRRELRVERRKGKDDGGGTMEKVERMGKESH